MGRQCRAAGQGARFRSQLSGPPEPYLYTLVCSFAQCGGRHLHACLSGFPRRSHGTTTVHASGTGGLKASSSWDPCVWAALQTDAFRASGVDPKPLYLYSSSGDSGVQSGPRAAARHRTLPDTVLGTNDAPTARTCGRPEPTAQNGSRNSGIADLASHPSVVSSGCVTLGCDQPF